MLSKISFNHFVVLVLIFGCIFSPVASAFGLLVFYSAQIADKYFTRNITDQDKKDIQNIKADVVKLKIKTEQEGLAKAFGRQL